MNDAIEAIIENHAGERVAVVSHAGAINAYIASLLGLERDYFFPAGNTSISVVRARDRKRLVVTLNDIAHLEYAQAMYNATR
jgi:broad specificity phosphatase PhoE